MAGRPSKADKKRNSRGWSNVAPQRLTDRTEPGTEGDPVSWLTRRQRLQQLWTVEKIRDRRHQTYMLKTDRGPYKQTTQVNESHGKIQSDQSITINKVSTVTRHETWQCLNSGPGKSWIPFFHWENVPQSTQAATTDKTPWSERPETEATRDSHTFHSYPPDNQMALPHRVSLASSCRTSGFPSIVNNDPSIVSLTANNDPSIVSLTKPASQLPPVLLPRIYTLTPRPLQLRDFTSRTRTPGPITDDVWGQLKQCRYIRHAVFGGSRPGSRYGTSFPAKPRET